MRYPIFKLFYRSEPDDDDDAKAALYVCWRSVHLVCVKYVVVCIPIHYVRCIKYIVAVDQLINVVPIVVVVVVATD